MDHNELQRTFLHDGCVIATFSQASDRFGQHARLHCVANSVCTLIKSVKQCPSSWSIIQLNEILESDHTLYEMTGKQEMLLLSYIPKCLNIYGTNYNIKERKSHIGSFICPQEEFGIVTINMLHPIFMKYEHFLLCICNSTDCRSHCNSGCDTCTKWFLLSV